MSRHGLLGRIARLALLPGLACASELAPTTGRAQVATPTPPTPPPVVAGPAPGGGPMVLPPVVQVVRFQGPEGVRVEVLGPNPDPVPAGDGHGLVTVGLRVGTAYRLRVSNLPDRPGAELYPVVELVGHLHRPPGIDPGKYPIRVVFSDDDLVDAVDHGRLVTHVVYLEGPDQALPITLPKDEIPVVTLNPSEEPLRVASALGRPVAIIRMGGRKPVGGELDGSGTVGLGLSGMPGAPTHCPFSGPANGPCPLPCGPVEGCPPPAGRPWLPRDEYLCDGGDRGVPVHFGGDGGLRGIDPRDAVIQFHDGSRPRALPTNIVCLYAPRFAEVRVSVGPNEALLVESALTSRFTERDLAMQGRQNPKRLTQNEAAEIGRHRSRASGLLGRVFAGEHSELRVLSGFDNADHIAGHVLTQFAEDVKKRQKAGAFHEKVRPIGIKTAEAAVLNGIIEGAGEQVMSWKPHETVGVEVPPNKPGLAVIKRVSASEAEAGDTLTYVIQYRNMGNTPIRAVSVVDSLLPRLGYVPGSALGPKGTVFTAAENRVGSTELRWDLPGALAPGSEGYVSFRVIVR